MKNDVLELLLIEDNFGDARLIQEMLNETGTASRYHITHVTRLSDAIYFLKKNKKTVDIILSDISLPDVHGFDTLFEIQKIGAHLPVIFITGTEDDALGIQAIHIGAQDYLQKSKFDGEVLVRSIRYALERNKTEIELKKSEEQYRTLFNSIDEGFCVIEMIFEGNKPIDYRFIEVNPVFEKQTGLTNAVGKTAKELIPNLEDHWFKTYGKVAKTGISERFISGSEAMGRWFDVHASKVGGNDSCKVALVFNDITERKNAETALLKSESKIRRLIDSNMLGVMFYSPDGLIKDANKYFLDLVGYSRRDIEEGKLKWTDITPVEFSELDREALEDIEKNGISSPYEKEFIRKDGTRVPIQIGGASLLGGDNGGVAYVIDATEQKMLERQKDDFIGIASHELKTPVTSIKAYAQMLERRFNKSNDTQSALFVSKMDSQLNKLSSLIEDLLDVTKIESGRLQFNETTFDFNELVEEVVEEIQRTTESHTLVKKIGKAVSVFGDRERIGQVVINFLTNAIKYSPKANKVVVKTTVRQNEVTLCVEDFGVGISPEKQEKVFERFYRVSGPRQETFPGLGLGLYISSEIIKRQDGKLTVNSAVGKGSTFCFSIPLNRKK